MRNDFVYRALLDTGFVANRWQMSLLRYFVANASQDMSWASISQVDWYRRPVDMIVYDFADGSNGVTVKMIYDYYGEQH